MTTQTDALARAIEYLGAVEVAPGYYGWRSGYYTGAWVVANAVAILREWELKQSKADYGSHDRALEGFVFMPSWWSPERRFAVRTEGGVTVAYALRENALANAEAVRSHRRNPEDTRAITASLITGGEEPCQ